MKSTLTDADGTIIRFKDGVAYVTNKPTDTPDPQAAAQQALGPDPLSAAVHVIDNKNDEWSALSLLDDILDGYPDHLETVQKAFDEAKKEMGPSITTVFQRCLDRCDGAVDYALVEIFNSFEKVFPGCKVEVTLPGEDAA